MAFSPDGRTLAAAGTDGTVWLWNVTDPARPARLGQPLAGPTDTVTSVTNAVSSVVFSPGGRTLAAGNRDGTVWLWNLDVDDAIQRVCATTGNTLTPARWEQYIPELPYDPPCAHPGHYGFLIH